MNPTDHLDRGLALRGVRDVIERLVRDSTAVARSDGTLHDLFPVAASAAEGEISTDDWHARCHLETDTVRLRQPQRIGEALHSISVGSPVLPALEETDRIYTQPGPLGQFLLRQTRRISVLAQ